MTFLIIISSILFVFVVFQYRYCSKILKIVSEQDKRIQSLICENMKLKIDNQKYEIMVDKIDLSIP